MKSLNEIYEATKLEIVMMIRDMILSGDLPLYAVQILLMTAFELENGGCKNG